MRRPSPLSRIVYLVMCGVAAGGIASASAQTTASNPNGVIQARTAQAAQQDAASASNSLTPMGQSENHGLDTKIDYQTFDVQHQQMMTLTVTGLGINVGSQSISQALDVAGNLRVRPSVYPTTGSGSVIEMDGSPTTASPGGQRVWLTNRGGSFTIMDDQWTKPLFTLDQSGNVASSGNILANGELQTIGGLRLIGGGYGSWFVNDGAYTYLLLTEAGQPFSATPSALRPLTVSDGTGLVTFGNGINVAGGGVTFPDGLTQTVASNYGGEYSQIVTAGGGGTTCTTPGNYKTGNCSCPKNFPNAHQFVNFQLTGGNTLQSFVCASD